VGAKASANGEAQDRGSSEPDYVRQANQNARRRNAEKEAEHLQARSPSEILEQEETDTQRNRKPKETCDDQHHAFDVLRHMLI
jgi:hypothetical protein